MHKILHFHVGIITHFHYIIYKELSYDLKILTDERERRPKNLKGIEIQKLKLKRKIRMISYIIVQ